MRKQRSASVIDNLGSFLKKDPKYSVRNDDLPKEFDLKAKKALRKNPPNCELCEALFITRTLGSSNKRFHCKRCAKAVCDVCSESRRQLSVQDSEAYRVCDICDNEMDNFQIKLDYDKFLSDQQEMFIELQMQIQELD